MIARVDAAGRCLDCGAADGAEHDPIKHLAAGGRSASSPQRDPVRPRFQPFIIAAPGTGKGPCSAACAHVQCAEQRRMAGQLTKCCGTPVGFDEPYLIDPHTDTVMHERCLNDAHNAFRGAA